MVRRQHPLRCCRQHCGRHCRYGRFPGDQHPDAAQSWQRNDQYPAGFEIDAKDGQDGLTINTNHLHQNGFNFEVDATAGLAAGETVTVNYGDNGGGFPAGSTGTFASLGYDNVNINVSDIDDTNFYTGGIAAVANGSGAEVLTIDTSVTLHIGSALTADTVGTASLLLVGGTIIDPTSGTLNLNAAPGATAEIGVTNANIIQATGNMFMEAPDNAITLQGLTGHTPYTGDVVTSTGDDDVLQGSMGSLSQVFNPGNTTSHTGMVGNDSLTDTTGGVGLGNWFYGEGGQDTINVGNGDNTIFFGSYHVDLPIMLRPSPTPTTKPSRASGVMVTAPILLRLALATAPVLTSTPSTASRWLVPTR